MNRIFFLQASANDFQKWAGPIGLMLSIVSGVVGILAVLVYKNLNNQVKEKVRENEELKREIVGCRRDFNELKDSTIERLNSILDRNSSILEDNSIAIHENSSVLNQALGMMKSSGEKLVEILEKVLDKQKE